MVRETHVFVSPKNLHWQMHGKGLPPAEKSGSVRRLAALPGMTLKGRKERIKGTGLLFAEGGANKLKEDEQALYLPVAGRILLSCS